MAENCDARDGAVTGVTTRRNYWNWLSERREIDRLQYALRIAGPCEAQHEATELLGGDDGTREQSLERGKERHHHSIEHAVQTCLGADAVHRDDQARA